MRLERVGDRAPDNVYPSALSFPARLATLEEGLSTMTRRKKIYEGKAKILYEGPVPGTLIQYF